MFPETHYLQVVACKLLCRLHSSSGGSRGHSEAENTNDVLQQHVTAIQTDSPHPTTPTPRKTLFFNRFALLIVSSIHMLLLYSK